MADLAAAATAAADAAATADADATAHTTAAVTAAVELPELLPVWSLCMEYPKAAPAPLQSYPCRGEGVGM